METYTKLYDETSIQELYQRFKYYVVEKKLPYVRFQIRLSDCVITVYESNKVVFQGENARFYSDTDNQIILPQAGSDEVGTGDYFGPVVVCAAYIDENNLSLLSDFKITDSKQLSDDFIRQNAPKLIEELTHSLLILDPFKYNQVHLTNNMNQIKAKLHNQAYAHLKNKLQKWPSLCVVDQFTPESLYYRYLKNEPCIIQDLTFKTKAESQFPSVAAASMIARYAFLKAWDKMEEYYQCEIPKGAGKEVDKFGKTFIQKFGKDELGKIAKLHFKNSEKIGL